MAKKLTKRKAFNFLRSYYDVLNELNDDKDKLNYLLAIIDKQFLDEDPEGLNFITNLCYESQRHAIESSVNGWKRAEKTDLLGTPITIIENTPPTTTPTPSTTPPTRPHQPTPLHPPPPPPHLTPPTAPSPPPNTHTCALCCPGHSPSLPSPGPHISSRSPLFFLFF